MIIKCHARPSKPALSHHPTKLNPPRYLGTKLLLFVIYKIRDSIVMSKNRLIKSSITIQHNKLQVWYPCPHQWKSFCKVVKYLLNCFQISPCRCLGSIRYVHNNCLLVSFQISQIYLMCLNIFLESSQLNDKKCYWKHGLWLLNWIGIGSDLHWIN